MSEPITEERLQDLRLIAECQLAEVEKEYISPDQSQHLLSAKRILELLDEVERLRARLKEYRGSGEVPGPPNPPGLDKPIMECG